MLDILSEEYVYKKLKEKIKNNLEYKKINSGLFKKNPDNLVWQVFVETLFQLDNCGYHIIRVGKQKTFNITMKDAENYKKLKFIK